MAIVLSIETSTSASSIALHEDGQLISSQHLFVEKSHSEQLIPSIKYLLETSGVYMNSIDAVAVSKGPGSYTGLRIGVSTAKGICYALDANLIAINTLEAMAYGMSRYQHNDALLCPMIDARRMEVYCLVAKNDLTILETTQAKIINEASFSTLLVNHKIVFFGNGALKCRPVLNPVANAIFVDEFNPSAEYIGAMAWQSYLRNDFEDTAYFEPFYLKDFIAKKPSARNLV